MWTIQFAFFLCILYRLFLSFLTLCNSHFSRDQSNWSSASFYSPHFKTSLVLSNKCVMVFGWGCATMSRESLRFIYQPSRRYRDSVRLNRLLSMHIRWFRLVCNMSRTHFSMFTKFLASCVCTRKNFQDSYAFNNCIYRVIQKDCRCFNSLSYTIHLI
jgi:hypothetical protein